jgi:PPOX class probable F420-dependent enzyme
MVDRAELRRLVADAPVARLATIDPEGRPHLVPICFVLADDLLYSAVDQKPKRSPRLQRLENIRLHPQVAVLVDHYENDWTRLWWARLRGPARVLESAPERERPLELLAAKYPQYAADPPRGNVIEIRIEEWRVWSAT